MIDKRVLLSSLMLALSCSAFFPMADAQTIYWTDIETHKIQRATLEQGPGVEDLVTVGVITPTDIALDPSTPWDRARGRHADLFRARIT